MRARIRFGLVVLLCGAFAGCGSSGAKKESASAVTVRVASPADGSTVKSDRITVRGTVTPPDAAVQVVGQAAQVGNGVFTTSIPLHSGSNSIDVVASAAGAAPATTTVTVTRKSTSATKKASTPATSQRTSGGPRFAGSKDCGGGVTVGSNTSCPFADNVRAAYEQTGSGILDVRSPVTGQTYRMYCTAGAVHVCTGGNNASVYFGDASGYSTGSCGGGVSVGPNTSCGFAANVKAAYQRSGADVVTAYSPATNRSYTMYCTTSSPHVCTGGNDAAVYFP